MESYSSNCSMAKQLHDYCTHFNEHNKIDLPCRFRKKKNGQPQKNTEAFSLTCFNCPIEGIEVIDIRIKSKLNEDEIYLNNDDIFKTIRRGNSIVHQKNSEKYSIGRMGLPKFFDYSKKYAQSSNNSCVKNRVVKPIAQSQGPYAVYFTEKANGENFQVSFNSEYQAWIVGSKNVSLLVRDEKDLEWYVSSPDIVKLKEESTKKGKGDKDFGTRFKICLEFATLWLQIVKRKIGNKLEEFKKEMADHTFIGENVGNKGYQHIKHYDEKDAIFYSIINNRLYDKEICLPLHTSFGIFKKYNLSHVPVEPSGQFKSIEELIAYLNVKYDEILLKKVSEGGEGSVAYFVSCEGGKETVLGLAKLKTFEYRFLRKVREKSKSMHNKGVLTVNKACELLKKEALALIEDLQSKVDFDNYLKLGYYMLHYADRDPTNYTNVYADFIAIMKESFGKGINVNDLNIEEIKAKLIKSNTDLTNEIDEEN